MFRELIRKNKQLTMQECIHLLKTEKRGVLCVTGDNGYPYAMPMNHWYNEADGKLYFHCGTVGHRLDALKKDDRVCFTAYDEGYREPGQWALNIKSVVVFGRMRIVDDPERIVAVTTQLCYKFTQDEAYIQQEIEKYGDGVLVSAGADAGAHLRQAGGGVLTRTAMETV